MTPKQHRNSYSLETHAANSHSLETLTLIFNGASCELYLMRIRYNRWPGGNDHIRGKHSEKIGILFNRNRDRNRDTNHAFAVAKTGFLCGESTVMNAKHGKQGADN